MAWLTVLGPSEEQVEYRLSEQCGCDRTAAPEHDQEQQDAALDYRLQGADRPITRIGSGWEELGYEAGQALRTGADYDSVRAVMGGADPTTGQQLVAPKMAVDPRAKLAAAPLVAAVEAVAAAAHTTPAALLAHSARSAARFARLVRGLARDGEGHRAPIKDLRPIAAAAGVDLDVLYDAEVLAVAREHADAKVRLGNRGYDLVLNMPKSVSVLYGLADPATAARIEELYLRAVSETVDAVQGWCAYGVAGHHGDGRTAERVDSSGLLGTVTLHRTARPVDGQVGDPHLHAHVMIANMVRCDDGQWRTVASGGRDLHRHVQAAGEMAKARVRDLLAAELGVEWERCAHSGEWEIAGIDQDVRGVFSRRAEQVRAVAGDGASAGEQRAQARKSAHAKQDVTQADLRTAWVERATDARINPYAVVAEALWRGWGGSAGAPVRPRGPGPDVDEVAAQVWDPEHGVTAHAKTTTRAKVLAAVADAYPDGIASRAALEALTDAVLDHPMAVRLPAQGPSPLSHADRYTSVDLVHAERAITAAATMRRDSGAGVVPGETVKKALAVWQKARGFALSVEQCRVVVRLLMDGHGLDMVQGVAGAGKTSIMSAARACWEAAGLRVEGAAVAAVAAEGLRAEAGITARTVASWLQRIEGGRGLEGVDVLVLDEAAMVADRDLAVLVGAASRTGTKIVGIGDEQQLRPVGAGGSFARVHQLLDGETLTENRRQRTEVDRAALQVWRQGAHRSALALWSEHGRIHAPTDLEAAYGRMAAAWWADRQAYLDSPHEAIGRVLMLAATNRDVHRLNTLTRAIARTENTLTGDDVTFRVRGGDRLALAVGDQVRVRRNDYRSHRDPARADVLNGHRALVVDVHATRGARIEWRQHGEIKREWISPDQIGSGHLVHGYAITVAAAQGLTCDRAHVLGLGADANTLYPAMSRARDRVELYLPAADLRSEEDQLRHGPAADEREELARVLAAYTRTLAPAAEVMVTDELPVEASGAGAPPPPAPAPEPEPVPEREPGPDPARERVEDLAARLAQARAQAAAAETLLRQRRTEAELAEERARLGRVRLMWQGAAPGAAREAAYDAGRERSAAIDHDLRASAAVRGLEKALHAAEREYAQRQTQIRKLEPYAASQGITRSGLHALDTQDLADLEAAYRALQNEERDQAWRNAMRVDRKVVPRPPKSKTPGPHRYPAPEAPRRGYGYGR
ncbi:MobF family relaxase [Nocardiopsis sp. CT-R113]|uniref:MobF family relaxase n=1 Tax=Nocardiopsis codii TaxID=3065942 RepID=A0ABU7KH36_9ACTN|nr:MobF family relaxase [Nocardiopsis sp. CT-R113]MEE2041551.1 MobF family relaxase [Nocardiopsis sp. CT-R113]